MCKFGIAVYCLQFAKRSRAASFLSSSQISLVVFCIDIELFGIRSYCFLVPELGGLAMAVFASRFWDDIVAGFSHLIRHK